jgi:hypothetical protein
MKVPTSRITSPFVWSAHFIQIELGSIKSAICSNIFPRPSNSRAAIELGPTPTPAPISENLAERQ